MPSPAAGVELRVQVDANVDRYTKQGPPHSGPTSWAMF